MTVQQIYVTDPKKEKEIKAGAVLGDTFIKNVNKEHYMVKEEGYGIQYDILPKLYKMGVRKIEINTKAGSKYEVEFRDWISKGRTADYGHGKQVFLNKKFYKKVR